MVKDKEPSGNVDEEAGPETELELEPEATKTPEEDITRVDIVTGDKKMVMSAPIKEFDELKSSFKAMMVAFGNFIEAAGLEIGKDETTQKITDLSDEIEKLREELANEEAKVRDQLVTKDDFEEYKAENEEKIAQESEDYIRREEFDRFRQAIREVL